MSRSDQRGETVVASEAIGLNLAASMRHRYAHPGWRAWDLDPFSPHSPSHPAQARPTPIGIHDRPSRPAPEAPPQQSETPQASANDNEKAARESDDRQRLREAHDELQAARRRLEREADRSKQEAKAALIAELFPVLDSLDRSIAAAAGREDSFVEGVKLVRQQLEAVLLSYGVERLQAVGKPFDPNFHDAIGVVAVDDPSLQGVVMEEWEPGYRAGPRVLRAAKVQVGRR